MPQVDAAIVVALVVGSLVATDWPQMARYNRLPLLCQQLVQKDGGRHARRRRGGDGREHCHFVLHTAALI